MKILLISQIPPAFELQRCCGETFPSFQSQAYWLRALKQLGHQVKVFLYTDPVILPSKLNAHYHTRFHHLAPTLYNKYRLAKNRYYYLFPENYLKSLHLNSLIQSYQPQVIIISGGISDLVGSAFCAARQQNIPILLLHGVNPNTSATGFEVNNLHYFTHIITNDPDHARGWQRLGTASAFALPYAAIDPAVHRRKKLSPTQKQRLGADVVFVGTLFKDRQQTLKHLLDFDLKIYGDIPPHLSLDTALTSAYHGPAWGEKVVTIYNASKIVLNLVPPHMPTGGNMRTFEIPGCGAFQLATRCPKQWFIPNQEIVLASTIRQLKSKIRYYLSHPKTRQRIAQTSYHRTHKEHTYKHRFLEVFQIL